MLFFESSQRAAGEIFRKGLTQSRRQSEAALFQVVALGRLGSLAIGGKRQPEADGRKHFSGVYFRRLEVPFAEYRPKAESCLELHFFGSSQRAAWGVSRSVGKGSRRLSGRNVFSGYISGRWRDFLQRIDQKPKAVWREYFFGLSQQVAWGASRSVGKGSRKRTGVNIFPGYISEGWRDLLRSIDQKLKAFWSCSFSSYRSGSLGEPRGRCGKAAGSGWALKLF